MMKVAPLVSVARRVLVRPALRACAGTQASSHCWMSTQTMAKPHSERELVGGLNAEELGEIKDAFNKASPNVEVQGGLNAEQLLVLDQMFGKKLENLHAEVKALRKRLNELDPAFAVDAPDGEPLGHEIEEKLQVDHIIQEAALHEDKKHVEKVHKLEEQVKKFHARDPEHDW